MKQFYAAALIGAAAIAPAGAQEIKIGYALAEDSHYGVAAKAFKESLTESLGDQFTFRHFPSSGLGGEREVVEGVQLGTVEMTIVSTGTLSNFVPESGVFDVPFLFRDLDHARKVLDGEIGQDMLNSTMRVCTRWPGASRGSATSPIIAAPSRRPPTPMG